MAVLGRKNGKDRTCTSTSALQKHSTELLVLDSFTESKSRWIIRIRCKGTGFLTLPAEKKKIGLWKIKLVILKCVLLGLPSPQMNAIIAMHQWIPAQCNPALRVSEKLSSNSDWDLFKYYTGWRKNKSNLTIENRGHLSRKMGTGTMGYE